MSTPYDPDRDPDPDRPVSDPEDGRTYGHDVGGGEHVRPGHTEREGEYEDRDVVPGGQDVEAVGSYVDRDVTPGEQEHPRDEGEYTDHDVVSEQRRVPDEGEYTDVDPEEDVQRTQERDDTHG